MESEVQPSAQEQHGSFLLRQLARMRAAEELTDMVLLAEGISFPCHKVVLSAFSPYFQVKKENATLQRVDLKDLKGQHKTSQPAFGKTV